MPTINPKLLEVQAPKSNGVSRRQPAREGTISWLVLMKNAFSSALEKTTLKVQVSNEKDFNQKIGQVTKLLQDLVASQKKVDIGRTEEIKTGAVGEFRITNLEKLSVDKIENLASAFKELAPILEALQSSVRSDKQTIGLVSKLVNQVSQLNQAVAKKELKIPDTQKVSGSVEISKMPDTSQEVVSALTKIEQSLNTVLRDVKAESKKEQKIELSEGKTILNRLDRVADALVKLPGNMEFPTHVEVSNFPPHKYPNPVTNININPLRGTVKSRNITVGTSVTPLPDEVLAYRRSIIIYNNGASTLYIGGSDVTATNGLPVAASSYSPALDAGPKMILYGISASGNINVRVFEASNENIGG